MIDHLSILDSVSRNNQNIVSMIYMIALVYKHHIVNIINQQILRDTHPDPARGIVSV